MRTMLSGTPNIHNISLPKTTASDGVPQKPLRYSAATDWSAAARTELFALASGTQQILMVPDLRPCGTVRR